MHKLKVTDMTNQWGLDVQYFERLIKRELSDIRNQTPSDLARVFARMSRTADKDVMFESEFQFGRDSAKTKKSALLTT